MAKWNVGMPRSEETKAKISRGLKKVYSKGERIAWNKGKKCPEIGLKLKGRIPWNKGVPNLAICGKDNPACQPGAGGKISKAKMGHSVSKATRNKISEANKGQIAWNKGTKGVMKAWNKGKKCLQTSKTLKARGIQPPPMIGILSQQKMNKPTSIEKKVYDELKARGLLFETQKLINGKFLVDAYILSLNLVIEADGDYWHSLERVKKRDNAKNAYLTKCGFGLLRLTETEINNGEFVNKLDRMEAI